MRATEPLPLHHSWAVDARAAHFALGRLHDDPAPIPTRAGARWRCDLADDTLEWDPAVFDLFGLARGAAPNRLFTVGCYAEASRAAMERLRAYAIARRRGFTLDVEVGPPAGSRRWLRLIASPVLVGRRVVALEGIKIPLAA